MHTDAGHRGALSKPTAVVAGRLLLVVGLLPWRGHGEAVAEEVRDVAAVRGAGHAEWVAGPAGPLAATAERSAALDDSAAVVAFLAASRGVDPLVCDLAARSVSGRFGWGGMGDTPASAATRDERAREVLLVLSRDLRDPGVVAPLRAALADADVCVRHMAAPLLGRADAPGAFPAMLEGLRAASAETREMAALALGVAERAEGVEPLIQALGDAAPRVRAMSAWALGATEDPRAVEPLARLLRGDADPVVRRTAAWALGQMD